MWIGRDRRTPRSRPPPWAVVAALALLATSGGCAGAGRKSAAGASSGLPGGPSAADADAVRSVVMSLADSYSQTVIQSLDALVAKTADPRRAAWAREQRVATLTASVDNATAGDSFVGLLDMVVLSTLKRAAVEEHWVPTLLGDEGKGVAEACRRGEAEAWAAAGRLLTEGQLAELRRLIDAWRREHPGGYYAGNTRFSDFEVFRRLTPESPEVKVPGSLFALLYADPLAGLDAISREVRHYREQTERMAYRLTRMSTTVTYQVDAAVNNSMTTPIAKSIVSGTTITADVTDRFTNTVADLPKALPVQRQAAVRQVAEGISRARQTAIDQSAKAVAGKREAIAGTLREQDARIVSIMDNFRRMTERVEQSAVSLNESTTRTVTVTAGATNRTMDRVFRVALAGILSVLLGVPLALLGYRLARRRLLDSGASSQLSHP